MTQIINEKTLIEPISQGLITNLQAPLKASGDKNPPIAGYWLIMAAMLNNLNSSQNYQTQLVRLADMANKLSEKMSNQWVVLMNGEINQAQDDIKKGGDAMGAEVNAAALRFNMYNTLNSQSSSSYNTMSSGVEQSEAAVSQTVANNTAMMQQATIATLQTLAQVA